jgi:hypothetical protein
LDRRFASERWWAGDTVERERRHVHGQIDFTPRSARTSVDVGGATEGQVSSSGAVPGGQGPDDGSGQVQFTGTMTHAMVHQLRA